MFNQPFNARIDGFDARIRNQKGNNQDQSYCRVHLLYEFDESLAAEIGGPAPGILDAMIGEFDAGKVGAVPLTINSKAVNVRFRIGRKNHTIRDTIALDTRVIPPSTKNLSAMLAVKVSFLAADSDVLTLWDAMGQTVTVRMDREQLSFPGMGDGEGINALAEPETFGEPGAVAL